LSNVLILGCGKVGKTIALDLDKRHTVTVADTNKEALNYFPNLNTFYIKNNLETIKNIAPNFDLVVCAVPGSVGFKVLKTLLESKVDVIDISFSPENILELNDLAIKNGVTAFVDMGVAPGLDNIILGYYDSFLNVESFECLVGGLPKEKYTYKAPFSPADVIEEYTRPARFIEKGKIITKEALSDPQHVVAKGLVLQSFNTDGLRSLLETMKHIPNMKEKTLRYVGHREEMIFLRDSGFFNKENLEFTSKVLFDKWKLLPFDDEFTFMRVTIKGDNEKHVWELYDETDKKTRLSSMSRTTGYTCCAMAEVILSNQWGRPGIFPGELVGRESRIFKHVISFLKERNIELVEC